MKVPAAASSITPRCKTTDSWGTACPSACLSACASIVEQPAVAGHPHETDAGVIQVQPGRRGLNVLADVARRPQHVVRAGGATIPQIIDQAIVEPDRDLPGLVRAWPIKDLDLKPGFDRHEGWWVGQRRLQVRRVVTE